MPGEGLAIAIAHDGVPGRLRLRVPALRGRPERARRIASALGAWPDIHLAEPRPVTGSLILRHDPSLRSGALIERLRAALEAPDDAPAPAMPSAPRAGGDTAWHAMGIAQAAGRLGTDADRGLDAGEAAARLGRLGPNRMPRDTPPSRLRLFGRQFASLPVLMLAGSAATSIATGGVADAIATLAVVGVNGVLGYVTEAQAERTIHALMEGGSAGVQVLRDGVETEVPATALVPGDVVVLRAGAQVPADARLIGARGLMADESALTGESMPVEKRAEPPDPGDAPIGSRATMLHAGSIVAEGEARAMVVATGARSEAARIQLLSASAARPQARIEAELDRLGGRLVHASLAACAGFAVIGLLRGHRAPAILRDALALAVAAVPEGLPMVATSTLSLGLRRMERQGILIRQMNVVESLGALQTVCLDKTGTLTQNSMEVVAATAGAAAADLADPALVPLAEVALLNNAEATEGAPMSQTEAALVRFARGLAEPPDRPLARMIPRGPGRNWMATLHDGLVTLKGAPEAVLERCDRIGPAGDPLDEAAREAVLAANDRLAARPARVLAFARGETPPEGDDPRGLTFLGLVAMVDPLREDAPALIRDLHGAGLDTVLITGDQGATAAAIARQLDLARGDRIRVVDSTEITEMPPELLAGLAAEATVFARVASHQKLAILRAIQQAGRVVAMTGDGVNDAPALAAADVGIAMGESGAALARDVANVVIRDDRLATLSGAIAQGRAIHRNIRRALEFLITTNGSEILTSIVEAAHGPGELETPMELLWINLVTDVLPGLGLALADPDPDVMTRPPREAGEPIIPARDMRRMAIDSAVIAAAALGAHFVALARYGPGPRTRGMTFLALSQGQLLYTLACQRSDPVKLHPRALLANRTLDLAVLGSSALGALPFFSPALRRLLGIAPLSRGDIAVSLAAASVPLATVLARRSVRLTLETREARG